MKKKLHIAIIGGGLAGLVSAIDLCQRGFQVTLIEKDSFPRHKVCGEYISNEILPYFEFLGIHMKELTDVKISKLFLSTQDGNTIESNLNSGGFGVSRYTLDHYLYKKAIKEGTIFIEGQAIQIKNDKKEKIIILQDKKKITCDLIIGAFGKRSNLDKALQRDFTSVISPWLGVKAHYQGDFPKEQVALHNFDGGYCGISKVEEDKINVCYLVHFESFKAYRNLEDFEYSVLHENKYLRSFLNNSEMIFDKPITISQVNFAKKKLVEDEILMVGDAAGLIHPLCGNGMAMAIKGAKLVADILTIYADGIITKDQMYAKYKREWKQQFSNRLRAGRILQKMLLNKHIQQTSYKFAKMVPALVPVIIKQTHGKPMVC
ncbi:NAD(P)/FAD-dependent oxidoreductase [Aquimarina sp. ERC-38]|uniref:NAD(P)/FAD-dependent oxidoreductase n=1 Tax=Aquimarina sp. ERC-38 TaxID=2949996 RepID=UPI002246AEEB|nr:NAD(P)/FAD-dependent oxidoreductase [Aquimarina sp. ERC-38]UZO80120.1 NAD(P)/FAD-dependent oxidoreductase [Aquimarina sp. ERC-38]